MSEARAKALRAEINQATADYVDAAINAALANVAKEHRRIASQIEDLKARATQIETTIKNLEGTKDSTVTPDDKYALTKRKLINLMDRLGIE